MAHPTAIATYAAAYFGGPIGVSIGWIFGIDPVAAAIAAGGIGILSFLVLGWRLIRRRASVARYDAVLFALASFVAAGGLLTAFGRAALGIGQALSSRYATQVVLFWLMLVLLGAVWAFGARRKFAVMALAFPGLILIAVSQPHFADVARNYAAARDAATPALLANVADPLLINICDCGDLPLRYRAKLQSARTSIFSEGWTGWIGTRLADHAALSDARSCRGSFDEAISINDESHPGWRAVGRLKSAASGGRSNRIVLADSAGLVVGYGLAGLVLGADIVGMSDPHTEEASGWVGAFTGSNPGAVTAYALIDDGRTACPLGVPRKIGHFPEVVLSNTRPANLSAGGFVDAIALSKVEVVLSGWGMI